MANQGGTHDQHVKAGKQSQKNAGASASERNMSSGSRDQQADNKKEKQMKGGQQSLKGKH